MAKAKKTAAKAKKSYTMKEKEFSCKLPKKAAATYTALRADSAAVQHVEKTVKAGKLGERTLKVEVTGPDGKKLTIPVRETVERKLALVKKGINA